MGFKAMSQKELHKLKEDGGDGSGYSTRRFTLMEK